MEEIEKSRGRMSIMIMNSIRSGKPSPSHATGPAWLRKLLGDDLFTNVTCVSFSNSGHQRCRAATPQRIDPTPVAGPRWHRGRRRRAGIPQGIDPTQVAESRRHEGRRRRAGTPQGIDPTPNLYLGSTKVSDAGLQHLEGLTQLQRLYLDGTKVSDAGLEHLKGLTQLQGLCSTTPRSATPGWSTSRD